MSTVPRSTDSECEVVTMASRSQTLPPPLFGEPVPTKPKTRASSAERDRSLRIARYTKFVDDTMTTVAGTVHSVGVVRSDELIVRDAEIITASRAELAPALGEAIEATPRMARYIDRASEAAPWAVVVIAVAGLVGAIVMNHKPHLIPQGLRQEA